MESFASGNVKSLYKEKFIVHVRQQRIPVNATDITCFSKEALHYLHTFSGDQYILEFTSLEEIEELLDPKQSNKVAKIIIFSERQYFRIDTATADNLITGITACNEAYLLLQHTET